jgi:hypothetical protein
VISGATDADAQPQACSKARPPPRARTHRRLPQEGYTASRAAVTIAPHLALAALDGVMTPMPDNFFASVRDQVFAFFTQLPDRVLFPVWEWILFTAGCPNAAPVRVRGKTRLRYTGEKEFQNRFNTPRDTIRDALGPLTLRVEYTDIYKKRFVEKRSLDRFLRELPERLPPPSDER